MKKLSLLAYLLIPNSGVIKITSKAHSVI